MATRSQLIDDLELRLYSSKPSDDIEFSRSQAAYLIDQVRDELLTAKFNDQIRKNGRVDDPFYYVREEAKTLVQETVTGSNEEFTDFRYSFLLDNDPLPLMDDKGIVRVRDSYGNLLAHVSEDQQDWMQDLPFGGITTKSGCQAFYRENRNIFVEPTIKSSTSIYNYNITYIPSGTGVTNDEEYPLEDSLVPQVTEIVEQILRREMQLGLGDTENDGTDPYHDAQPEQ